MTPIVRERVLTAFHAQLEAVLQESVERNTDAPSFALTLDTDLAPIVQVTEPVDAESTAAANGQLQVDGTIGDDFGIDKVRLRMRHDGRDLASVPYMGGKSFRREKDNTWPSDLSFKLSADLGALKYADGARFEPKFGGETSSHTRRGDSSRLYSPSTTGSRAISRPPSVPVPTSRPVATPPAVASASISSRHVRVVACCPVPKAMPGSTTSTSRSGAWGTSQGGATSRREPIASGVWWARNTRSQSTGGTAAVSTALAVHAGSSASSACT